MILAMTWLGLALLLCAFSWVANRRLSLICLPLAAVLVAAALWVPTGQPRITRPPPGDYQVLSADIHVDVAIYLLLKKDGEAVYYRLPYSTSKANELQDALNAGEGKGIRVKIDGEGGESYDGPPPVTAEETKIPENPEYSS